LEQGQPLKTPKVWAENADPPSREIFSQEEDTRMEKRLAQPGRFLSFHLGYETYAVPIMTVSEIIGMSLITHVPNTPDYVRGVLNLRGSIVPVVDLRIKFNMPTHEDTPETCIVVVEVEDRRMGVVVDSVKEVVDYSKTEIEPTPSLGQPEKLKFVHGIGKKGDAVSILIDIASVVTRQEMEAAGAFSPNQSAA
jgi:purine-binding chemotaxis protein CheW